MDTNPILICCCSTYPRLHSYTTVPNSSIVHHFYPIPYWIVLTPRLHMFFRAFDWKSLPGSFWHPFCDVWRVSLCSLRPGPSLVLTSVSLDSLVSPPHCLDQAHRVAESSGPDTRLAAPAGRPQCVTLPSALFGSHWEP